MLIDRDPGVISGFRIEEPLDGWPILTHCGEAFCSSAHSPGTEVHPGFEFTYLVDHFSWTQGWSDRTSS